MSSQMVVAGVLLMVDSSFNIWRALFLRTAGRRESNHLSLRRYLLPVPLISLRWNRNLKFVKA